MNKSMSIEIPFWHFRFMKFPPCLIIEACSNVKTWLKVHPAWLLDPAWFIILIKFPPCSIITACLIIKDTRVHTYRISTLKQWKSSISVCLFYVIHISLLCGIWKPTQSFFWCTTTTLILFIPGKVTLENFFIYHCTLV